MKIMYICGMYLPSHGGAEISMYSLLKQFKDKYLWDVVVVTDSKYKKTKQNSQFNQLEIMTVQHEKRVEEIEGHILDFKPNLILTQLMWADVALKLAKKHAIPSIIRVCKVPLDLDLSKDSDYSPTAIIANSAYVQDYILKKWGRKAEVIHPLINREEYRVSDKGFDSINGQYIFMFNPLQRKGGEVFKSIAKKLPDRMFATVYGWSSLKESPSSDKFSERYVQRVTESEGSAFNGSLPQYVDFNECKNLRIFSPEDNARLIYKRIRLLLIPSQWEEAFGRVAVEAMVNGIPVIASEVAGLKDSVGKGGILVEKGNINRWVDEILKFDNPEFYKKMSRKAKKWAKENYNEEEILKKSAELIKSALK